jgi:hypothetical protein
MCVCVCVKERTIFLLYQGCSVCLFFGSKGLTKFVKVPEPSNCSKGLCEILGNEPFGSSPTFRSSQLVVYYINNFREIKGAGTMSPLQSRKRRTFMYSASATLYKSLAVQECVTILAP